MARSARITTAPMAMPAGFVPCLPMKKEASSSRKPFARVGVQPHLGRKLVRRLQQISLYSVDTASWGSFSQPFLTNFSRPRVVSI